jgi:hypothetical protein
MPNLFAKTRAACTRFNPSLMVRLPWSVKLMAVTKVIMTNTPTGHLLLNAKHYTEIPAAPKRGLCCQPLQMKMLGRSLSRAASQISEVGQRLIAFGACGS